MKPNNFHLNESEIIRAAIDQKDLPEAAQHHLSVCAVCQKEKERFKEELKHLTGMTTRFAPLPRKRLRIPLSFPVNVRTSTTPLWNRHPVFITGMVVTFLLVVSTWMMLNNEANTAQILREMEADQRLIAEIEYLEENIMPEVYTDISVESYGYFDEEFLDFVVPVEESRNSV